MFTDSPTQFAARAGWRRWLRRARASTLVTLVSILSGCWNSATSQSLPTTTPSQDTVTWEILHPGLERRILHPPQSAFASFVVLRIDPAQFRFRVHYRPGEALFLNDWSALLPDAQVIVNGNFFDPTDTALGLVVSDGVRFGSSYIGMGGLLEVQQDAVRVRSTITEPVTADETFDQVVQGFPMLVSDRLAAFTQSRADRPSRRTVLGQDSGGRILIVVSNSLVGMTLVDLSQWLAQTDLDLVTAFNLDGGGSTLLLLRSGLVPITIPSFDAVPTVLALYPR